MSCSAWTARIRDGAHDISDGLPKADCGTRFRVPPCLHTLVGAILSPPPRLGTKRRYTQAADHLEEYKDKLSSLSNKLQQTASRFVDEAKEAGLNEQLVRAVCA